jgi:hypothetical protein
VHFLGTLFSESCTDGWPVMFPISDILPTMVTQLLPLKAVMETIAICCHQPRCRGREMDWQ